MVPELASFNVELNGSPDGPHGPHFFPVTAMNWRLPGATCQATAEEMGCHLVTVGILPTIREALLNSDHMSKMVRYQALE